MDNLFEVNTSSVSNSDPPFPPQPSTNMIVCALVHNGSSWNLFWDYPYRISIKPTWYRSPQAVGECTAHFTTCWNVGQLHSHSFKFFLGCIYNLPKCWLHSHSSEILLSCIQLPLRYCLAPTQPVSCTILPCWPHHNPDPPPHCQPTGCPFRLALSAAPQPIPCPVGQPIGPPTVMVQLEVCELCTKGLTKSSKDKGLWTCVTGLRIRDKGLRTHVSGLRTKDFNILWTMWDWS